jgi:hypothetical protein
VVMVRSEQFPAWVPFERAGDGERTGLSIPQEVTQGETWILDSPEGV